jgi:pyruvate/2-oxoglutarate dehydrogenase complex dihydrolipoamide acyltransferase (E2) component
VCVQSPGKLVRQLVQDGEHVLEGQAFAEIEVMKMIQTLASPAAGVISFQVNEGSALAAGALIAKLELDDPTKVKRAETFTGVCAAVWLRQACWALLMVLVLVGWEGPVVPADGVVALNDWQVQGMCMPSMSRTVQLVRNCSTCNLCVLPPCACRPAARPGPPSGVQRAGGPQVHKRPQCSQDDHGR